MTKIHTTNGKTYVHDDKTGDTYRSRTDIIGHTTSEKIGHGCDLNGSSTLAERDSGSRVSGYTKSRK